MQTKLVRSAFCYKGTQNENFTPHFKFFTLLTHFSQILDISFHPESNIWDMGIGKELLEINACINNKDWKYVKLLMVQLWTCKENLSYIKKQNLDLYNSFKKELIHKCKSISNFRGKILFELSMSKFFIEKNIKFRKTETPDFIINETIGFECTSCQTSKLSFNKSHKLKSTISKKTQNKLKHYKDFISILGVDISNVSASLANEGLLKKNIINKLLESDLQHWDSIVLYSWNHFIEEESSQFQISRYDSPNINTNVQIFLDNIYPNFHKNSITNKRKITYLVSSLHDEN